jgi:hypothetical protein
MQNPIRVLAVAAIFLGPPSRPRPRRRPFLAGSRGEADPKVIVGRAFGDLRKRNAETQKYLGDDGKTWLYPGIGFVLPNRQKGQLYKFNAL